MAGMFDTIKSGLYDVASSRGVSRDELDRLFAMPLAAFKKSLLSKEFIKEEDYLEVLRVSGATQLHEFAQTSFDPKNKELLSRELAERFCVFAAGLEGSEMVVVVSDPLDIIAIDDLKIRLRRPIKLEAAPSAKIREAIAKLHDEQQAFFEKINFDEEAVAEEQHAQEKSDADGEEAPIVKLVDVIVTEAIKRRASDIHIEPMHDSLRVRYRIDGIMHTAYNLPKKNQGAVATRLKIMSNLNITENRIPQDGRFKIRMKKKEVDFRVSSLPVKHGEKFVLRALDKANLSKGLENAGFSQHQLGLFMKAIKKPYGICLVTGPTGSGKSTTLYSILNKLNLPEKHLVTIEDPVEYQVEGLTQIPINHEIQMTFSSALRAVLRQSPDVVMVGEIRDQETADIAIKASLTGQFILSTLHTNDAIGAVTRLADMGVEPFLLASSLVMTSAQRLCRKICTQCRMEYTPPERVYEKLGIPKDTVLYVGKGCEKCHGSGYSGREAVIEVLVLDEGIRDMIVRRASEKEIAEYARLHAGFRTLREDIMDKCIRGVTTVEEVFRITA
jgi:type IV pilus assembly protein PilB